MRRREPRPLGIAIDWLEIDRAARRSRSCRGRDWSALAWSLVAHRRSRASPGRQATSVALAARRRIALVAAVGLGLRRARRRAHPARGLPRPYVGSHWLVDRARARAPARRALDRRPAPDGGAGSSSSCCARSAVRLVLLLHPQFYYPDVQVHALFAWQLARHGLVALPARVHGQPVSVTASGCSSRTATGTRSPIRPRSTAVLAARPPGSATGPRSRSRSWPRPSTASRRSSSSASRGACVTSERSALAAAARPAAADLHRASDASPTSPPSSATRSMLVVFLSDAARRACTARPPRCSLVRSLALALLTYTQSLLNFGVLLPLFC